MKIRYDSWHYRLQAMVYDTDPTSLCPYVWRVLLAPVALGATFGLVLSVLLAILMAAFAPFLMSSSWKTLVDLQVNFVLAMTLCIISWLIIGGQALKLADHWYRYHGVGSSVEIKVDLDLPEIEIPFIALLMEWLKAGHKKICPNLEVV